MGSTPIRVVSNVVHLPPVPAQPALTSEQAPWRGLRVELFEIPISGEMPDPLAFERNQLVLHCGTEPYRKYWRANGRERCVTVNPGDVALISRQELSGSRWLGRHRLLVVALDDDLYQDAAREEVTGHAADFQLIPATKDEILGKMMAQLKRELQFGYPSGRLFGESVALAIARYAAPRYGAARRLREYSGGLSPAGLRRVLDYIDSSLSADLGVAELASLAGRSQYHFAKLFRASMGRTIHQYVLDQRVDAACRLMDRGDRSIAATGAAIGFINPCHFSAAFHRRVGVTPREYQNSHNRRKVIT